VESRKKKNFNKNGNSPASPGVDPRLALGRQLAVARRPRVDTCACQAVPIFLKFFYFKKMNFWKFGKWARAFGRMGVQHPHVLKLALHFEVLILPKFMENGDFTFFQK
jgi:hypothetical protein